MLSPRDRFRMYRYNTVSGGLWAKHALHSTYKQAARSRGSRADTEHPALERRFNLTSDPESTSAHKYQTMSDTFVLSCFIWSQRSPTCAMPFDGIETAKWSQLKTPFELRIACTEGIFRFLTRVKIVHRVNESCY